MATLLLSAAGAAIGGGFGGSVLGLSGAVIGRAVGATLGRVIDQRLMGGGSQSVETGRIDRFRLTGASEGAPLPRVWGRMRVAGQVIWASRFLERTTVTESGGGKGAPQTKTQVTEYAYSVSLALALCEGTIARVGRIWADGTEIEPASLAMRVYRGDAAQLPDPRIEAVEGAGLVPAFRGTAYVVIEDLDLGRFGNRVPQLSFEVVRLAQGPQAEDAGDIAHGLGGVALIPGSGEYGLATQPVHYSAGLGRARSANVNSPSGQTDLQTSLAALSEELPGCRSVSLVVCWFGDDLRAGQCTVRPKVEDRALDGRPVPWTAGGIDRATASEVPRLQGRPVYGGTPADTAVLQAIAALKASGRDVTFYPFVLMDQLQGNGRADPWSPGSEQPPLPWRGRITLSVAPGRPGSPDGSVAATGEVAAFFGQAQPSDFAVVGGRVTYHGPSEWSYRRFILHYAFLCALAGGVEAFCIGSELRGLTQARGPAHSFPAVAELVRLATDVRGILPAATRISYAADWSEYAGYDDGAGNRYFHLDPLWAHPHVDFVGVDNYLPLSDWRDGEDHADAAWGTIYDLDYLKANVAGGEYFEWYYGSDEERLANRRTAIVDGAHGEDWIWRAKDFRSWWENRHHDRIGGVRQASPSAWVPGSKPIRFTEFGCAALDKASNAPNLFLDPKSSESRLPPFSSGRRDDLIQAQYLRATIGHWRDSAHNPVSPVYGAPMIDMEHAHAWAWDARPYPMFPGNAALWGDAPNYARGHWISGRTTAQPLSAVVAEICGAAGVTAIDTSALFGLVRGYAIAEPGSARQALQPLMTAFGFDACERDGLLRFTMRGARPDFDLDPAVLAEEDEASVQREISRAQPVDVPDRVRLVHVEAEGDFETRAGDAVHPGTPGLNIAQAELALAMTRSEAQGVAERWLIESRVGRDTVRFALPPSLSRAGAGDVVTFRDRPDEMYRIDCMTDAGHILCEARRVEPQVYVASDEAEDRSSPKPFLPPLPVEALFLDLPLMRGTEVPHAPHLAASATPWPGAVAVYASDRDDAYAGNISIATRATIGVTLSALDRANPGQWDRGPALRVQVAGGALASVAEDQVLNGANLMAIGDGTPDGWELMQFRDAVLVAPDTYDLGMRLRGQVGTDALMPASWPAGSAVVMIDAAPKQIALSLAERGLARHYRIGPASRGYDDPSFSHRVEAFAGVGLRPLSVCHLRAVRNASGDWQLSWLRRTRLDGDSWAGLDVPLGETREQYLVRVKIGSQIVREMTVVVPVWDYPAPAILADGLAGQAFAVEVAQLSEAFGAGPFKGVQIDG